jgi:ABC-type branched-subunit amino acid transport system substrate-binding protein
VRHRFSGGRDRRFCFGWPYLIAGCVIAIAVSGCGSGVKGTAAGSQATTNSPTVPIVKTLGSGVTASTIRLGVVLVDFREITQFTDLIRTDADQKQIYQAFINDINAKGGIAGRKIVPFFRFYSPLGSAQILGLCTALAQDDNVFAVVGTFVDFSGDAQTCIAKQQHRVLMTFNLTQAIIDRSPPGLIITAGDLPERSASILLQLLQQQHTLTGKTVAVLGDTTESTVVNNTIVPGLRKMGVHMGTPAILSVGNTGDTTAAQAELESFIEKWKTEGVNALCLSGDLASTKQFVEKVKAEIPNMMLMADNTDVLNQAQQLQQSGVHPNPYEGILSAGGLTPKEYDDSANWKYCAAIYQAQTHKVAPDAEHTIKTAAGKIDDINGTINDACQTLTMFHDIAQRVGTWLNNTNWVNTVDHFGHIENRGSGPYSSLHTGKYSADDNWRLQAYDSSLGNTGLWKAVTPLQNIAGG